MVDVLFYETGVEPWMNRLIWGVPIKTKSFKKILTALFMMIGT